MLIESQEITGIKVQRNQQTDSNFVIGTQKTRGYSNSTLNSISNELAKQWYIQIVSAYIIYVHLCIVYEVYADVLIIACCTLSQVTLAVH